MNINKIDLTTTGQKTLAAFMLGFILILFWYILPPLITILSNLIIAGVLFLVIVVLAYNYQLIWDYFKQLSWELTKKHISSDKLWYMWRGYDYTVKQNNEVLAIINSSTAIYKQSETSLLTYVKDGKRAKDDYLREEAKGESANKSMMRILQSRVALCDEQINNLEPKLKITKNQISQLSELHDIWSTDSQILKEKLEAKEKEYELLKKMDEASTKANSILNRNSDEMKRYDESLKQIEKSMFEFASNIESFQKKIAPIITSAKFQKEGEEQEGLRLIEEYKKMRLNVKE